MELSSDLKSTLDELHDRHNTPGFIADDPVGVPHRYSRREDIEIAGFLASAIAWGNRKAIVKNARRMMELMDDSPYDFVAGASPQESARLEAFVHRTFNGSDFLQFVRSLRNIYANHGGLGGFFESEYLKHNDLRLAISEFKRLFFEGEHYAHARKHVSSPDSGSACKRLNMYLRWMVRSDGRGVDFGLWDKIPASALYLPLDLHAGNMARTFGLLTRKQNDWKAVEEATAALRRLDPSDPVKYDFALFGEGFSERNNRL